MPYIYGSSKASLMPVLMQPFYTQRLNTGRPTAKWGQRKREGERISTREAGERGRDGGRVTSQANEVKKMT